MSVAAPAFLSTYRNGGGYMSKELIRLQNLTMEFDGERILDGINL